MKKFDEIAAKRKISLFAGTDAHSNIGFHLFGDDAGNKLINIKLDPYESTFRIVRVHVLLEKEKPLTRENLIVAFKASRYFVGFDALGDTSGFRFEALGGGRSTAQGGEFPLADDTQLRATLQRDIAARFVVYRNGEIFRAFSDADRNEMEIPINEPGEYRVEVYLEYLGSPFDKMPWIISNPIYVR